MSSALTIGGVATPLDTNDLVLRRMTTFSKGGVPNLTFQRRAGALPGLPDPYLGKTASLTINSTLFFTGDVVSEVFEFASDIGWCITYQCLGLANRAAWIPFTDDNTGTESAAFNAQQDNQSTDYIASRAGRNVGQILTTVLQMTGNATALNGYGIGNYTTLSPPTLPSVTVTDLAALTIVPPCEVYVQGEKLLGAIEAFMEQWAPNILFWIDPSGNMRFLDMRTFAWRTLTMGTDPIEPVEFSRDVSDCFQQVEVRGQPLTEGIYASLSNGLLAEDFAHDGLSNSAAKAAWTPNQFRQTTGSQDHGTCTCPSTTTVTVTSADATLTWVSDYWDQTSTGRHGWIYLAYSAGTGLTQYVSRPIVANTALTAGGTSTFTLGGDPLPITSYDSYQIFGLSGGARVVWTKYSITNATIGAAMANMFVAPVPFILASGGGETLTSYPIGSVVWGGGQEETLAFTQDPTSSTIQFNFPTYIIAGNAAPTDVRALLAINKGVNQAFAPSSSTYQGTSNTVEGLTKRLTVTVDQWRDPGNTAAMAAYAQDILDSVKDAVMDGTVKYYGFYPDALTPGISINIEGNDGAGPYFTGWANSTPNYISSFTTCKGIPVVSGELEWLTGGNPNLYITTMHLSNRRARFGAGAYLRPSRTGITLGGDFSPFGEIIAGQAGDRLQTYQERLGALPETMQQAVDRAAQNRSDQQAADDAGAIQDFYSSIDPFFLGGSNVNDAMGGEMPAAAAGAVANAIAAGAGAGGAAAAMNAALANEPAKEKP